MTSEEGAGTREPTNQMLGEIVREAEEYYVQLRKSIAGQNRLHVTVVGAMVWFATFAVLGIGAYFTIPRSQVIGYLVWAFLTALVTGTVAAAIMYYIRQKRETTFQDLGALITKMKSGSASSEDGLKLADLMHQAALTARKKRLDSAFEYGVAAFIIVSIVGTNAGFGALAGVVTYLYFRFEALRQFEKEDGRYEASKKELLLSL